MIRAALKSLLGRKVRLLMSTLAIVFGVAFVVGTLIFSDTLNRSFTSLFASTVGDVVVRPAGLEPLDAGAADRTVPAALVEELAALPGVDRADGMVSGFGAFVVDPEGKLVGGAGPPALAGNYTDAPAAGGAGLQLVAGDPPTGEGEVVLDTSTAERAGYEVGDDVPIVLPLGGNDRITPRLVGLLGFPEGGSLNGATFAAFDTRTAQDLFLDGDDAFSEVWVTAADGVGQAELADRVRDAGLLPDDVEVVTGQSAADEQADVLLEAVSFLTVFLLVFAGIALVVGTFIIVNTFSMLVAQRSRELALLRAMGASRRQVAASVQLEAFVVGLVGSTLGLGLGVALAIGLRALFGRFGLDLSGQPLVFSPRVVLAAYGVGVVVTMVAAAVPARRTATIAPVQALRDDVALTESSLRRRSWLGLALLLVGAAALTAGLADGIDPPEPLAFVGGGVLGILLGTTALAPLLARPFLRVVTAVLTRGFGEVGKLAGQNALRNPRRTAATASALMIGLALAGTMAIVGASAKASIDATVEENFVGDYVVSNVFGAPFNTVVGDQMAEVDGVDQVVRQRIQAFQRDGGSGGDERQGVAAVSPEGVERLGLETVTGDLADLRDGTVALTSEWAAEEGLAVGDTLTLTGPDGEVDWPVVATFESTPIVFLPVLTTPDSFTEAGFRPGDNALLVFADPDPDLDPAADGGLQDRLDAVVADNPLVSVKDQAGFAAEQREPVDQFVQIIYALLGLALLIAVLGIVNTLALSVVERTREVGLLRAVGVTRAQLRGMIALESVVISLLGAVLGVVLGIGFGIALMTAARDEGLEVVSVPGGQLVLFLVVSVVVGLLAAVLPARRAARLDVLDAVATE